MRICFMNVLKVLMLFQIKVNYSLCIKVYYGYIDYNCKLQYGQPSR